MQTQYLKQETKNMLKGERAQRGKEKKTISTIDH